MTTWAEVRDAFIAEQGWIEIPDDFEIFRQMLQQGRLDGAIDWTKVVFK